MLLLALWSTASVWFCYAHGWLLYYGDAEAHLNIARQIFDSQTPGYRQIGTPWLPLPHLLMLPLVRIDGLWRNGLAGAIPSAACLVAAAGFLFAAVRRLFHSTAAAAASAALFAGNPNVMYLQSTAMTEAAFFACLLALLYFSVRFHDTQGWGSVAGAGAACCLGTLARYEGWFLVPFASAYFLWAARRRRFATALVFSAVACLGPAYWLAHNWWITGDALAFNRGPYSARAIQGSAPYPGRGNWRTAWLYFRNAAALCVGPGLAWAGCAGIAVALIRRAVWPVTLLLLPAVFYLWSMHSGASPIFVPSLMSGSFYNTRYGLSLLPLLAMAAAAWVTVVPRGLQAIVAVLVVAAGTVFWLVHPGPENWVTWEESLRNSEGRRKWVAEAAQYLAPRFVRGSGIISSSGEFRAVYRKMGIPLRESFSVDNDLPWLATVRRPELWLWQEWVLAMGGDPVESAVNRAARYGIRYRLEKTIITGDAPVIEIYRRIGGKHGSA